MSVRVSRDARPLSDRVKQLEATLRSNASFDARLKVVEDVVKKLNSEVNRVSSLNSRLSMSLTDISVQMGGLRSILDERSSSIRQDVFEALSSVTRDLTAAQQKYEQRLEELASRAGAQTVSGGLSEILTQLQGKADRNELADDRELFSDELAMKADSTTVLELQRQLSALRDELDMRNLESSGEDEDPPPPPKPEPTKRKATRKKRPDKPQQRLSRTFSRSGSDLAKLISRR